LIVDELEGGSTRGNEDHEHDQYENVTLEDIELTNDEEQVPLKENKRKKVGS